MIHLSVVIAAAALGFDVGWQRLPEGGMEYIIRLDPQTLDALRAGQVLQSDIPSAAGDVRSYRIVVGGQRPPREAPHPIRQFGTRPIENRPAPLAQPENKDRANHSQSDRSNQQGPPAQPAKPWLPLTLTLLGLFVSVGSNLYLGWIALGLWRRCRRLAVSRNNAAATP